MYPNLYYAFRDLFGIEINALKIVNSFGFFVAIAFLAGAWVLANELRRKKQEGLFSFTEKKEMVGMPASFSELFINFILGFVFGYKFIGVLIVPTGLDDPQAFIFSWQGSIGAGILLGVILAGLKWWEKNKQKLPKPKEQIFKVWPHDRIGNIVILAAVAGFLGAKIFDNLEHWDNFIQDPIGNLLSASGLTFYGGLILATITIMIYLRKHKISMIHVCDAAAPALLLSYAVGRIGCQVSGDGDWGIVNTKPNPFSFLPDWMWSYDYPHNVISEGIPLSDCDWGKYCTHLSPPVFPTPLYEVVMCMTLFALLWFLRKHIKIAGRMFALYLFVNGLERFVIEQIRVNTKQNFFGLQATQAEIIAATLMLSGVLLFVFAKKIRNLNFRS